MGANTAESTPIVKIGWMIVSAVVTALIGIPLTYYLVTPLTPKASLSGRIGDTKADRVNYFLISNPSNDLFARNVAITFSFARQDHRVSTPGISTDPTCKEHNTAAEIFQKSFICDNIVPKSELSFFWVRINPNYLEPDYVTINIAYEGYNFTRRYTRCHRDEDTKGGTYFEGSSCRTHPG
jgi:hypothetical protein